MKQNFEVSSYNYIARLRTSALRPLAKLLDKAGVKPDHISYLSLASGAGAMLAIKDHQSLGLWLLILMLFLDGLDGPLARYQGHATDRGKFTDTLIDTTTFVLIGAGLARAGLINDWIAVLYVYFFGLTKLLMIFNKELGKPTDWLINPRAGLFPHFFSYATYILFAVYVWSGWNGINAAAMISVAALAIKAAMETGKLRRKNPH